MPAVIVKRGAAILLLALGLLSCAEERGEGGTEILRVTATPVETQVLQDELTSFGSVSYKAKNDITVQVEGTISSILFREGDWVGRDAPIALLKNVQLEIQLDQTLISLEQARTALSLAQTRLEEARLAAESRLLSLERGSFQLDQKELELEEARSTLRKRRELWAIGGLTDEAYRNLELSVLSQEAEINMLKKELEIAALGLRERDLEAAGLTVAADGEERKQQFITLNTRSAQAELEAAQANLRNTEKSLDSVQRLIEELTIRSSVPGILGALYFENGEFAAQNEKLATIMDISRVLAVFFVQEQDIRSLGLGSALHIDIPSLDLAYDTGITEISPVADPQSGNFSVKAELPNAEGRVKPGMFVKCRIPRGEEQHYPAIPETALLRRDSGEEAQVFCVVNGIAVLRDIRIAARREGTLWIASGLKEGDLVIDKPSPYLKEGLYVEYR
ncbi:MAG: efflux RND transporter periplasmic adaptor subunit [Treponema sp.]|jgi:membrane fusion protein (multidrug efflux system)|nr:efflux RND transporter periplasmic adaptor subunit [Treponema sp.]